MFNNCINYFYNCVRISSRDNKYKENENNDNIFCNIDVLNKQSLNTPNNTPSMNSSARNSLPNISPGPYLLRDGSPDPNVNTCGKDLVFSGGELNFINGTPTYVIGTGIFDNDYEISLFYNIDCTRLKRIGYYTYDGKFIEYEVE